jgi:hypothetical protein
MTTKDKMNLIKDLCGRLPFGVKCYIPEINDYRVLGSIQYDGENTLFDFWNDKKTQYEYQLYLSEFKPYLFPIPSMIEEQFEELQQISSKDAWELIKKLEKGEWNHDYPLIYHNSLNWLDKNHFDYRDLIKNGLAIDATNLNIY